MLDSILTEIDAEIARLQAVKALLSATDTNAGARKPGKPAVTTPAPAKSSKRRGLSMEARERMRQAQIKRWAAFKKSTRANLNTTVSPIPGTRKEAAKAAVK